MVRRGGRREGARGEKGREEGNGRAERDGSRGRRGAREEETEPLVVLWPLGVLPHLVLSVVLAQVRCRHSFFGVSVS